MRTPMDAIAHEAVVRQLAADCTVLLRSDGSFPLSSPCSIAAYGNGVRHTVFGGTGSGEVNSAHNVTVEEGLLSAGFTLTTNEWLDGYDAVRLASLAAFEAEVRREARRTHRLAVLVGMGKSPLEPDHSLPLDADADAALYVLSRTSGENADRRAVQGDVLLTDTEIDTILTLNARFRRFLLVLNIGAPVDLSPLREVRNILLLSQLGSQTGHVLSDLLLAKATPSGKLTTTYARFSDYPCIGSFGDPFYTRYNEGIYVGYRAFDALGLPCLFPFGHGLSWTTFSVTDAVLSLDGELVTVQATVCNTGAYPGKEVLKLYASVPDTEADQPPKVLAAFAKTQLLLPNEQERLTLTVPMRSLCDLDPVSHSFRLPRGDYRFLLDTGCDRLCPVGTVRLADPFTLFTLPFSVPAPDFSDFVPPKRRREADSPLPILTLSPSALTPLSLPEREALPADEDIRACSDLTLSTLVTGRHASRLGVLSMIGNAASSVAGAAGETVPVASVPSMVLADGPAGLRLARRFYRDAGGAHSLDGSLPETVTTFLPRPVRALLRLLNRPPKRGTVIHTQEPTFLPIATAVAQSFDLALAERLGDLVGTEMEHFSVQVWLAPAMNLHRDIRCGRNFEYFSEDPLLCGLFAAAWTRGVQAHPHCAVTLKHYAANNQETNRTGSNSLVSERALFCLYLRSFGLAIQHGNPLCVMTSYNLLNGTHTSESAWLISDILRSLFGFSGVVMTDWLVDLMTNRKDPYPPPNAASILKAGGDLLMPGSEKMIRTLLAARRDGSLPRERLEEAAMRLKRLALLLNT